MKDFLLNNNGDLSFSTSNALINSLEFNFFVSQSQALFLNIFIENYNGFKYLDNLKPEFIFNFEINVPDFNKDILLTKTKEDYNEQQIKIRLDSALNSIRENLDIGSDLDLYKHKIMLKNDTFDDIKESVINAINDIIPNPQIEINRISTIYLDYSNSLMIIIKAKEYTYYYYL